MRSLALDFSFLVAVLALAAAVEAAPPSRRHEQQAPPLRPEVEAGGAIVALRAAGPEQILIPAGTFTMGSDDARFAEALELCRAEPRRDYCHEDQFSCEQAAHEVYLDGFWIDRAEVTVARYRRCVAAGACVLPPFANGAARFDRPELPVVLVSWNEARRFCDWAGGRLPTEAEWERAARGLSGRRYPWGNVYNPFLTNHGAFGVDDLDARDGFLELAPVGSFPDGRTPEGILDLAGNAQEWVGDWFAPEYPQASAANPRGPDAGDDRVLRGGGYVHARPWLRGASRDRAPPGRRAPWIGFRCARAAAARP